MAAALRTLESIGHSRWAVSIRRSAGLLVILAFLAFTFWLYAQSRSSLPDFTSGVNLGLVMAAWSLYVVCTVIGGLIYAESLRIVGRDAGWFVPVRVHLLSTPARYIPGPGGQYMGRIALGSSAGIGARDGALASVVELSVISACGLLALLILLPSVGDRLPWPFLAATASALGYWPAVLAFVTISGGLYLFAPLALRIVVGRIVPSPGILRAFLLTVGTTINWFLVGTSVWLLSGSAFGILSADLILTQFSVSLSLLTGLLGVTPMGVGVREGTLVLVLSSSLGRVEALALALGWRLLNVAADAACFGVAIWLPSSRGRTPNDIDRSTELT